MTINEGLEFFIGVALTILVTNFAILVGIFGALFYKVCLVFALFVLGFWMLNPGHCLRPIKDNPPRRRRPVEQPRRRA